ncbi:MAG: hypothetical protein K9G36_08915 [Crocinitomicaceae bacterium]|nr:hypothetical protein [Crocinitomicaceae bacterium]MCF8411604.1 hypothetical protein [Crocinitomicaceae bacterium]MCF8444209.1 hypothetical protein [Crocinitomicaceae bacterium]
MNTRKFKIYCDGRFGGFIFINDNNPQMAGYILATIWPFEDAIGSWTENDLEIISRQYITDVFNQGTYDDEIKEILIARTTLRTNCSNFIVQQYD